MTYTQAIFEEAGSTLSPSLCAIIVSFVQLAANVVSIGLVDRIDRRKLFSFSAMCTAIGLVAMGLHSVYKDSLTDYALIPIMAFSFTIFVASCGILPVHFVILVEIMPKKVCQKCCNGVDENVFHAQNIFSDSKCGQFNLYDGVVGFVSDGATNIPDDVRNVWHARLYVLLCGILLLPGHLYTCGHS